MNKGIFLAYLCAYTTSTALAQDTQFFVGYSFLSSKTEYNNKSDQDDGYELRVGYNISEYLSIESSYLDLGVAKSKVITTGNTLTINGHYHFSDFNLYGKAGLFYEKRNVAPSSDFESDSKKLELLVGAGVSYKFNDNWDLRVEYNFSENSNWGGVGFNYYF